MICSYETVESVAAFEEARRLLLSRCPERGLAEEEQLAKARTLGYELVAAYWQARTRGGCEEWTLERPTFADRRALHADVIELAYTAGSLAALLDPIEAAYRLGSLYAVLLPRKYRSENGIYYTPPPMVGRLLGVAETHGVDWRVAKILDPACGGGAFLAPLATRMMEASTSSDPEESLKSIESRLLGFEIDTFGAWSAQLFAEIALLPLCKKARRRLRSIVRQCDSLLQFATTEKFDLVMGNPPYGRTRLRPGLREKYDRSLFGHANLYTLFTDLSLRLTKPGGVLSLVTPTSFLAGEYFKSLRRVLVELAGPLNFDFVSVRKGVFDQVLQETVLATYRKGVRSSGCTVNVIRPRSDEIHVDRVGEITLPTDSSDPWPLPRSRKQLTVIRSMNEHQFSLKDYGYEVATGPLVWNRHKDQIHSEYTSEMYPLIWAESIGPDGMFNFRAEKRNHKPFFRTKSGQEWLVTRDPCILLQRTTAKEQSRRLIAAALPRAFLDRWEGVVVENHVNIIRPVNGTPIVPISTLVDILNSDILDQAFRCLSGSVAVSAYELNAVPLPEPSRILSELQSDQGGNGLERDVNPRFTEIYVDHRQNGIAPSSIRRRDQAAVT